MKRQLWTIAVLSVFTQMLSLPGNVEAQTEAPNYGIQEVSRINELIRQRSEEHTSELQSQD